MRTERTSREQHIYTGFPITNSYGYAVRRPQVTGTRARAVEIFVSSRLE